ncbi:unnamed protein product [Sphagnum compactum]
MTWHSQNRSTDGKVRHVPDSRAWEHIDATFLDFANEPRNGVRGVDILQPPGRRQFIMRAILMWTIHDFPGWMYLIERALKTFKAYVQNKARPEASMAEGYIYDETIGFVIEYMQEFKHVRRRIWDAYEEEGVCGEVLEAQVQQVFYAHEPSTPWSKIVLHKEPRSKRVVVENSEEIHIPVDNVIDTEAPLQIPEAPSDTTLVDAIELTGADAILVAEGLQRPSNDDEEEAMG